VAGGLVDGLDEQPRLADAGLSLHQQHAAAAAPRAVEQVTDRAGRCRPGLRRTTLCRTGRDRVATAVRRFDSPRYRRVLADHR
jgi:hypothetical protein